MLLAGNIAGDQNLCAIIAQFIFSRFLAGLGEREGMLPSSTPQDAINWFAHDPARWDEFQKCYRAGLDQNPQACRPRPQYSNPAPLSGCFPAEPYLPEGRGAWYQKLFNSLPNRAESQTPILPRMRSFTINDGGFAGLNEGIDLSI
jgi:hypothetical protein